MSLFKELKRRNVFRVAVAYIVATWLLLQIVDVVVPMLNLPDWVDRFVFLMLIIGFPIALIFAWAFELTPEGLKKESDVDRSQSITDRTGRKLDFVIIGILLVAVGWFSWDKFNGVSDPTPLTDSSLDGGDLLAVAEKSVAVLPFIAMTSGIDAEYFADGLTEEILNSLAQLPELLVTARTSAFSFKGQDIPVQQIAAALGVQHIVEGSVRKSGERMRITAQLIRASDGFHLWSENYDSTSADTIAVQENIAEKIAVAMDIVLDEDKRAAMRAAGLRNVEAFTIYQKGVDFYERAHGEIDMPSGLRQANVYFEKVMELVPDYGQVYTLHSDRFIHMLNDSVIEEVSIDATDDELANAFPAAISDYEAASRHARTSAARLMAELDLAFLSGNWRGLSGRMERALATPGCSEGNWTATIANVLGHAKPYADFMSTRLACDPLRTLSWFNVARSTHFAGDKVEALRLAREGLEVAPGAWLSMTLIRILVANGDHEEASREIESQIQGTDMALGLKGLVAASRGDRQRIDELLAQYAAIDDLPNFWRFFIHAWGGYRDEMNKTAAQMDQHHFGSVVLWQLAQWCSCGSPWDLEVTPNFAAKLEEGNVPWPPPTRNSFPLKDW